MEKQKFPSCPSCESKLEELVEITGYHYWMCGNSDCEMSYKFYRKAVPAPAQVTQAVSPHLANVHKEKK